MEGPIWTNIFFKMILFSSSSRWTGLENSISSRSWSKWQNTMIYPFPSRKMFPFLKRVLKNEIFIIYLTFPRTLRRPGGLRWHGDFRGFNQGGGTDGGFFGQMSLNKVWIKHVQLCCLLLGTRTEERERDMVRAMANSTWSDVKCTWFDIKMFDLMF